MTKKDCFQIIILLLLGTNFKIVNSWPKSAQGVPASCHIGYVFEIKLVIKKNPQNRFFVLQLFSSNLEDI